MSTIKTISETVRVVGVELAECPEDGGKWVIYCEHYENGEWLAMGMAQDTNKRRLAEWKSVPVQWCPVCQEMHEEDAK